MSVTTPVARVAVLLSGRGSNFVALAEAIGRGEIPAEIVLVVSNQPAAPGIAKARSLGLPTIVIPHRGLRRAEHEERVLEALTGAGAEWVCLAGYMRLLSPLLVGAFRQRILNIHPSLLPAFPGLDAQEQAWRHGVRVAGCTVHLVDEELDNGPIVVQRVVEVRAGDSPETLSARILAEEHRAYPEALQRLLTEPWAVAGRRLVFGGPAEVGFGASPAEDGFGASHKDS